MRDVMQKWNVWASAPRCARGIVLPTWPLKTVLIVLFCGPLIAPLFQATGLPLFSGSGALARDLLASYVCPTPAKSYVVLSFPMAVCARCWGATVGLWLAWFVAQRLRRQGRFDRSAPQLRLAHPLKAYRALAWPLRLILAALPFFLWTLEIQRWAMAPYEVLLLNGAHAGFWAGLFICSVWPGTGWAITGRTSGPIG